MLRFEIVRHWLACPDAPKQGVFLYWIPRAGYAINACYNPATFNPNGDPHGR